MSQPQIQKRNPFAKLNLKQVRLSAWQRGLDLSYDEVIMQMRQNGSTPRPNPWFRGQKSTR